MVSLVIEGGATRAAYASGAALGLREAGFVPDAIYGTSAGGALAAWFAAGQPHLGIRTWDRLTDPSLLAFRRIAGTSEPVLDFRRLYDQYYPMLFGMDIATLRRAPFPVVVTMADADAGTTAYADLRKVRDPFRHLHATSAMPIVSESPVEIDGRRFVDGGLTDPIPIQKAIADGARDIVAILNRPAGARDPEPKIVAQLVGRKFPALADVIRRHHDLHNDAVRLCERPPAGVRVRIVRPARELGLSRFTRDMPRVHAAIEQGRVDARASLA